MGHVQRLCLEQAAYVHAMHVSHAAWLHGRGPPKLCCSHRLGPWVCRHMRAFVDAAQHARIVACATLVVVDKFCTSENCQDDPVRPTTLFHRREVVSSETDPPAEPTIPSPPAAATAPALAAPAQPPSSPAETSSASAGAIAGGVVGGVAAGGPAAF